MPENATVLVLYGPYEACGIVKHRTSRLQGLERALLKEDHEVEFDEIEDWNSVELWVNAQCIYKCNITELDYGGDGILDPNIQRAVDAVRNAF